MRASLGVACESDRSIKAGDPGEVASTEPRNDKCRDLGTDRGADPGGAAATHAGCNAAALAEPVVEPHACGCGSGTAATPGANDPCPDNATRSGVAASASVRSSTSASLPAAASTCRGCAAASPSSPSPSLRPCTGGGSMSMDGLGWPSSAGPSSTPDMCGGAAASAAVALRASGSAAARFGCRRVKPPNLQPTDVSLSGERTPGASAAAQAASAARTCVRCPKLKSGCFCFCCRCRCPNLKSRHG
eukprot:353933-Chlamydomonas_euryale.AAC.4